MTKQLGRLLMYYGLFLFGCGLIGYALTDVNGTVSLLNGTLLGGFVCILGTLIKQSKQWAYPAALSATGIFTFTFVWRGIKQWNLVAIDHAVSHWPVAMLLTVMTAVSIVMLLILLQYYRH